MYKILLVDDEDELLNDRSSLIAELGYQCITAKDGEEAIKLIYSEQPDIIYTDMKMPNKDGFEILKKVKEMDEHLPVILFTGYGTIQSAVTAMKLGAFDYIQKPVTPEIMEISLTKAANFCRINEENIALKNQLDNSLKLDDVTGKTKIMMDIAKRVHKVAKSEANVLIYGESGTGKEAIARNIHSHSKRCKKSFIPLDCVALPATLLESEIFGYEQGAFTGAYKSKPGVLELADGGTLFLDEIAELDLNLQAKLLRVLQERQFRRVGGMNLINVDLRIISATNQNPEKAVTEGKLRNDLYYRLNVVPIFMPPLRKRKEDIPLLVNQFIKKFNPSSPKEIKGISKKAMKMLMNYDWPGNIRELQNTIEQAISLIEDEIINVNDLPENIIENDIEIIEDTFNSLTFKDAKEKILNQFYHNYFNNLIRKHNGNISKVAEEAGISRKTFYRLHHDKEIY